MRSWIDRFVMWKLKRKMRKHGYTERVINRVISYYTKPKEYSSI